MPQPTPEIRLDLDTVEEASARGHALDFPRTLPSDVIEGVIRAIGSLINWTWALLVAVIVVNVVMRYALSTNYVWVEEVQWHMYAVGYMIGIAYAVSHDAHVRVDVLASGMGARTRAWVELAGILVLIGPMVWVLVEYAIPFVDRAWRINEKSSAPGGLANRWAIKSVMIVAFGMLALAAAARLMRITAFLFGLPRPRP
ncbi:MAG: TRAP transporter small permease subunit [Rhodobacteraceae bacterium]|jgi:TRAP-type mannitol/chloroaromatic compound transport system permease small subunit|nr:TRAP transporter small permease subunit [Paracoccaceae bacterium]